MDWDTGFLADPKFQHLRDLLPDPIQFGYAGFCYLRLTADAWRTCQRKPIGTVVRGIEVWAVEALRDAGLLEVDQLTQDSYDKWVGTAIQSRVTQAEYTRRSRGQSSSVSPSKPYTDSASVSESVPRTGRVEPVGEVERGVQGGIDDAETDLFAFIAQRGAFIRSDSGLGLRLLGLVDRRGIEAVMEKARALDVEGTMSDRQWVFGLEKALEAIPSPPMDELPVDTTPDPRKVRMQERVDRSRLEFFALTGKWDPNFGPEPEWQPEWGERPKVAA
jgi:hypothetical protein